MQLVEPGVARHVEGPIAGLQPGRRRIHDDPDDDDPLIGPHLARRPQRCDGAGRQQPDEQREEEGAAASRDQRPRASCRLAAATTASAENPNFFCSSLSGAEAPKVFMPMASPVVPT